MATVTLFTPFSPPKNFASFSILNDAPAPHFCVQEVTAEVLSEERNPPGRVLMKLSSGVQVDITSWVTFDPSHIEEFKSGRRQVDCTTIARAAEAGQLEFLQWCAENGFRDEFDHVAFGYAVKGQQREVAEWMLRSDLIHDFDSEHWGPRVLREARSCGVSEDLLVTLPFYSSLSLDSLHFDCDGDVPVVKKEE